MVGRSFFVEKNMYYEACIMLTRFYEYESKLSNFFKFANQVEKNLNKYLAKYRKIWYNNVDLY